MTISRKQLEALAWKHTARKDRTSLAGKPAVFVMRPCGPTALVLSKVPKDQLVAWLPRRVQAQVASASAGRAAGRAAGRSREPRNDEGFTFERWLKVANLDADAPGAFGAWRRGEDPRRVMRSGRSSGRKTRSDAAIRREAADLLADAKRAYDVEREDLARDLRRRAEVLLASISKAPKTGTNRARRKGRSSGVAQNENGLSYHKWLVAAGVKASNAHRRAWQAGEDPAEHHPRAKPKGRSAGKGSGPEAPGVTELLKVYEEKGSAAAQKRFEEMTKGQPGYIAIALRKKFLDALDARKPKGRSFGSHILAFLGGYGVARAVDHPDHVKRAASAVGRGARKTVDEAKKLGRTARDAAHSTKSSYKGGSEPASPPAVAGASGGRSSLAVGVLSPRGALGDGTKRWSLTVEVNGKHVGGTDFSSATAKSAEGFSKLLLRDEAGSHGAARWKLVDRKGAELATGTGRKR